MMSECLSKAHNKSFAPPTYRDKVWYNSCYIWDITFLLAMLGYVLRLQASEPYSASNPFLDSGMSE